MVTVTRYSNFGVECEKQPKKKQWSKDFPDEPGFYWFYGDPFHGQMGMDFQTPKKPVDAKMQLVEVAEISNGLIAIAAGHFFPSNPFDIKKIRAGYLGYFMKADMPEPPPDLENLFGGTDGN